MVREVYIRFLPLIREFKQAFLSDASQVEVDFCSVLGKTSLRVKTLSNTNLKASRHTKRQKGLTKFRLTCVAQKCLCINSL